MRFKEAIERDSGTFLNLEEFGEVVNISGRMVEAVVKTASVESESEYTPRKNITPNLHGVRVEGRRLTVYVRRMSLERVPRNGEMVEVFGVRYKVERSADEQGIIRIEVVGDLDRVLPGRRE